MNARTPFLAANWKMHKSRAEAKDTAARLAGLIADSTDREVAIFPPLTALDAVRNAVEGSHVRVGAQTCHFEEKGAYTGEVSAGMLADAGCELVLVGHSERRQLFGETDAVVRKKLEAVLGSGLAPILCVGEVIGERKAGRTEEVVRRQMEAALGGLPEADAARVTVAYEPVWAIGTGLTATPEQAQEVHAYLRNLLGSLVSREVAEGVRIQYGGSVKPGNIAGLMANPDLDGALVGGASLDAESFAAIVRFGKVI